jgi:hypothetical protein
MGFVAADALLVESAWTYNGEGGASAISAQAVVVGAISAQAVVVGAMDSRVLRKDRGESRVLPGYL